MEREVHDVRCAGRCARRTPHERVQVLKPGREAAWRVRCLACDGTSVLWLEHRAGQPGQAACGAALVLPVRLAREPAQATCPLCLRDAWRRLESRAGEQVGRCLGCKDRVTFALSLWLDPTGAETQLRTCPACGVFERGDRPRHLAHSADVTWCGLPAAQPVRDVVAALAHATCADCLWMLMADQPGSLVEPDWRPGTAIGEDWYAV